MSRARSVRRRRLAVAAGWLWVGACVSQSNLADFDLGGSLILGAASNIPLNGNDVGQVTVVLARPGGAPWAGIQVRAGLAGCTATPPLATSDAAGAASFTLVCDVAQSSEVAAAALVGGIETAVPAGLGLQFYSPSDRVRSVYPGTPLNLQVVVRDPLGELARDFDGWVHFTSSDAAATLPADTHLTAADQGARDFVGAIVLRSEGLQTVVATAQTGGAELARLQVSVSRGTGYAELRLDGPEAVAGEAIDAAVVGVHGDGSLDPNYAHQVRFIASDPQALLPSATTLGPQDAGLRRLVPGPVLFAAGPQSIGVIDQQTQRTQITGLRVLPAAMARLAVELPLQATAGEAVDLTLTAQDAYGNVASQWQGAVDLSADDANAQLPAQARFDAGDAGVHVIPMALVAERSGLLQVVAQVGAALGTGYLFVRPQAADALLLTLPSQVVAGDFLTPVVTAIDTFGNIAVDFAGPLSWSSRLPGSTLPVGVTMTPANGGEVQLVGSLQLTYAGADVVTVTGGTAAALAVQAPVSVAAGPPAAVHITTSATTPRAGVAEDIRVAVVDGWGNASPAFTGVVQLSCSDARATLPDGGTVTFAAGDAGSRIYPAGLTLFTAGAQTLQAAAGAWRSALQVQVVANAPAELQIANLPASAVITQPLSPQLRLVDAWNNTIVQASQPVELSVVPTGGVSLPAEVGVVGTTELTHQLSLASVGNYTLSAQAPALGLTAEVAIAGVHGCWTFGDAAAQGELLSQYGLPQLALDPVGWPQVVGFTRPYQPEVHVIGWDGASWQRYGASSLFYRGATDGRLRLDSQARAGVIWWMSDDSGIRFARRVGGAWVGLAGSDTTAIYPAVDGYTDVPAARGDFAFDGNDAPWLVVNAPQGGLWDLAVRRYDGSSWGAPAAGAYLGMPGVNLHPRVGFMTPSVPVVVWQSTGTGNNEILASQGVGLDAGGAWQGLVAAAPFDNVSQNSGTSSHPALALDANGRPWVVWQDDTSGAQQIYLRHHDGAAWSELGGSATGGGISNAAGAQLPDVAIDVNGLPVVVWWTADNVLMMRRWDGSGWAEEFGSASGGGVGSTSVNFFQSFPVASVAVGPDNHAIIAWDEAGPGMRVCSWR